MINAINNEIINNNQRWYLHEGEWQQVQRPPPIEIPAPPELLNGRAPGGAPMTGSASPSRSALPHAEAVTPPAFQAPNNAPPAPRAAATRRRRPILNPEEDDSDEEQPVLNNENQSPADRALALAHAALIMPHNATDRWKLLQNAVAALNATGNPGGLAEYVQSVLRDQHGL